MTALSFKRRAHPGFVVALLASVCFSFWATGVDLGGDIQTLKDIGNFGPTGDALNPFIAAMALILATAGYMLQRRTLKEVDAGQRRQLRIAALTSMIDAKALDSQMVLENIRMLAEQLNRTHPPPWYFLPDGTQAQLRQAQLSLQQMTIAVGQHATERKALVDALAEVLKDPASIP